MTNNHRRLILKLARFKNAVDLAHERAAQAYDMDSQFDAGEFSGPAIERDLACEEDTLAQQFGFESADVAHKCFEFLRGGAR